MSPCDYKCSRAIGGEPADGTAIDTSLSVQYRVRVDGGRHITISGDMEDVDKAVGMMQLGNRTQRQDEEWAGGRMAPARQKMMKIEALLGQIKLRMVEIESLQGQVETQQHLAETYRTRWDLARAALSDIEDLLCGDMHTARERRVATIVFQALTGSD